MLRIAALVLALASPGAAPVWPQHLPLLLVHAPRAGLMLEVARTDSEHERGLMGYTLLPAHTGMIFVFDADGPVSFWMKDTLIPLDIVFVAADDRVRSVAARVPTVAPTLPDDAIPLITGAAKYVIELSAGEAARDGITPGAMLSDVLWLDRWDNARTS